jgi:hypothetical protein
MSYVRDPYDTDEPPCFCGRQATGPVLTTAEFCPACGDPDKPVTEPEGNDDEPAYSEPEPGCCGEDENGVVHHLRDPEGDESAHG